MTLINLKIPSRFTEDEQLKWLYMDAETIIIIARRVLKVSKDYCNSSSLIRGSSHLTQTRKLKRRTSELDSKIESFVDTGTKLPEEKRYDYLYLVKKTMYSNRLVGYKILLALRAKDPEAYRSLLPKGR